MTFSCTNTGPNLMICILVPILGGKNQKITKAQQTTKSFSALWSVLASLATVLSTGWFPAAHWQQTVGDPLMNIVEHLAAREPAISIWKQTLAWGFSVFDGCVFEILMPTFLLYQFYKLSVLCFMVCCTASSWWEGIVNLFFECISRTDG